MTFHSANVKAPPLDEDAELERIKQEKLRKMLNKREGRSNSQSDIAILNADSFHQTLVSGKPVLVDYYADWCGPCKLMEPVFERVANKYAGRVIFARLNVDENPQIASEYGVFSIPTFILFDGGKPVNRVVGAVPEKALMELIARNLGG